MADPVPEALAARVPEGFGSVLYIGCGLASDLDLYLELAPERVVLVEPNPDLAEDLTHLAAGDARLAYLPVAVSDTEGHRPLNVFNIFDLSSLAAPDRLYDIYPGARLVHQPDVRCLPLADLVARADLPEDKPALLVIEAVGCEADILAGLTDETLACRFGGIILSLPSQPLFADALEEEAGADRLEAAGFTALDLRDTGNPDWVRTGFRFDPRSLRLRDLQAELADRQARHETLAEAHRNLQARAETLEADAARAVEELAAEKAALQAQSAQAAMTARQLALRDNDMRDLQARYRELVREKTQLEELLGAVTAKLHEGVHYIGMLEPDGDVIRERTVADDTDRSE